MTNAVLDACRAVAADKLTLSVIHSLGGRLLAEPAPPGVPSQRIVVAGALTTGLLVRAVAVAVAREGVFPIIHEAPFGAYAQEILDPESGLHGFAPDLVLLAPDAASLLADLPPSSDAAAIAAHVAAQVARFAALWSILEQRHGCRILQHLLVPPAAALAGVAELLAPASPRNQVRALNDALLQAGRGRVGWVDLAGLAEQAGLARFAPARLRHAAQLPFDPQFLPLYLPAVQGAWRAVNGRAKKLLVLDLDNTLWGGVIGDDGVDGIVLGAGSPSGEAFADWQAYLRALRARGVILAVCSKNDPAIAASGLTHPASQLTLADFADFHCSWDDKPAGLRAIAARLNLGLESFVFVDDNEAECDIVRSHLPEVAVVAAGADPAGFIARLEAGHWFAMQDFTAEDFARAGAYQARAAAASEAGTATDMAGFLAGLAMVGRIAWDQAADLPRLAQMEQKTNQFNTTTRRLSQTALADHMQRPDALVLSFRLADKFADHGLVASLVAVRQGDALRIESWLMSCRVFSRTAESFVLAALVARARELGLAAVEGVFVPNTRNSVVADLYARLGFAAVGEGLWRLPIDAGLPESHIVGAELESA